MKTLHLLLLLSFCYFARAQTFSFLFYGGVSFPAFEKEDPAIDLAWFDTCEITSQTDYPVRVSFSVTVPPATETYASVEITSATLIFGNINTWTITHGSAHFIKGILSSFSIQAETTTLVLAIDSFQWSIAKPIAFTSPVAGGFFFTGSLPNNNTPTNNVCPLNNAIATGTTEKFRDCPRSACANLDCNKNNIYVGTCPDIYGYDRV